MIDAPDLASAIASAPVFESLGLPEIRAILSRFEEQSFNAGHRVTLEGYRGAEFYLIISGSATVAIDGSPVARLGVGDFFGEIAVLSDGFRSATVTADAPLRCFVLNNNALEQLLVEHPRLGLNLLHEVVARLKDAGSRPPHMKVLSTLS
ncbi:MAG: cyclic nucleotide-binding domain-containing protein [Candidatus Dormibacteria bacterium]